MQATSQNRFVPSAVLSILLLGTAASLSAISHAEPPLPTGKTISLKPNSPGQDVGSLPMNMISSPDGQYVITTDMGFRQFLWSTRVADTVGVSNISFDNNPPNASTNGLYYGLAIKPDGTLYAAQGANDSIAVLSLNPSSGELALKSTIKTKKADFPSGLALDTRGDLYVANNDPSTFAQPSSVAIYDTAAGAEIGRYTFSGTPNFPLAIAAVSDGSKCYVSSQRDGAVYVLNTSNASAPTLAATLTTGAHPIALLFNKAQNRLYVANAHSDTVSIVNTDDDTIITSVSVRSAALPHFVGATPTGLALSPDEESLYVTLGDLNAVAVVSLEDGAHPKLRGYLPAGWYPTGVAVSNDGEKLLVANAKGTQPRYPNPGYLQFDFNSNADYDLNLIEGKVTSIKIPDNSEKLGQATAQVEANNAPRSEASLAKIGSAAGKIEHVIYIIKENRTYDQILGDIKKGNGDPSLALFDESVTPNLHALAKRFVLLDNFYVCAEASGDGWPWSTQSLATEYVIKNLPYNYSNRGRQYDFEGQINGYLAGGFPAKDIDGMQLSAVFPSGTPAIPDVSQAPAGHLWDIATAGKVSIRNYGCFCSFGVTQGGVVVLPDNYPCVTGLQPPGHDLGGVTDYDYRRYDAAYPDSEASVKYGVPYPTPTYGKYNMPSRFSEFNREFNEMLAKDASGKAVPSLMFVRLMHDHTQGYTPGVHSPLAQVADNDYGVGQLVDAVSHSVIWPHTAIFVLEDDAQDGPDHVDCHRSPCYVISPYIKASTVDSTFYNTDSVLRGIEQILGLQPMSQYDAIATPVAVAAFSDDAINIAPYTATIPAQEIITEINPALTQLTKQDPRRKLAAQSLKMNFDLPDSAPAAELNEILWKSIKGFGIPMPAAQHKLTARELRHLQPADPEPQADRDDADKLSPRG